MREIVADPEVRVALELAENPTWSERVVRASVEAACAVDLAFIATGTVSPPTPWEDVVDSLEVPALLVTGTRRVVLRGDNLTNITRRRNRNVSTAVVVGAPHCVRRTFPERFHAVVDPWMARHLG